MSASSREQTLLEPSVVYLDFLKSNVIANEVRNLTFQIS